MNKTRIKSVISQLHTNFQHNYYNPHLSQVKKDIMIMQAYAPMSTYDDDLAEGFYELLDSTIKEIQRKDLFIIQGDWNAQGVLDARNSGTLWRRRNQ